MYRLFNTIAYRKWLIMLITMAVFAVVVALTLMTQPLYKATASFQLVPETKDLFKYPTDGEDFKLNETSFYKTQYEILGGDNLANKVIDKLNLTTEQITRQNVLLKYLPFQLKGKKDPARIRADLLNNFQIQLQISPVDNSQIVYVNFSSPDKELSAKVANTFVEEYVHFSTADYDNSLKQAKESILKKIDEVRDSIQKTEIGLQRYTNAKDMVVTKDETNPYIDDITKLNQELLSAEKERIAAETALQSSSKLDVGSSQNMLDNDFVQKLKERLAELQGDYQKKLEIYKPDYPAMVQLQQQIKDAEKKLSEETSKFQRNLQVTYDASKNKEAEIRKLLDRSNKNYQSYVSNMTTYNELKRDLDVEKALYDNLLTRLKAIDAAKGINANNISILESAIIPQIPYSPNYLVNFSMGSLIAILIALSIAGLMDYKDKTVKIAEDIQALPINRPAVLAPMDRRMLSKASPADTKFLPSRQTLVSLQASRVRDGFKVLSLLALGKDQRHITFMHNLLAFFLQKDLKVLLIALEEDHAAIRKLYKLDKSNSYLISESALPMAVIQTDNKNLSVALVRSDDVFSIFAKDNHFDQLIHQLLNSYELIVLLSSEINEHPEAIPSLDVSDIILVNVLKRQTKLKELERLVMQLDRLPNSQFCILHDMAA